ncbi:hypothetical protein E1293_28685 [Actinomadura darangshiensis]|uniref:Uncharacterized protein n=1 Tax=Actinomadura darangshiensis TaxID=705336 RepID=A0A4R5AT20_9ACTN|nr:hypothetical protein [Actinomadura darangshiensis]TDD75120.1 hypothetical protein E1293_28685 [Actinomadura darangshiensis]
MTETQDREGVPGGPARWGAIGIIGAALVTTTGAAVLELIKGNPQSKGSGEASAATPPRMLPIESDENGTVDRCVPVFGTGKLTKGYTFVVGIHLHQDEDKLKNKRTYFPSRPVIPAPNGTEPWHVEPTLAVGPAGGDTSSYDIFLGRMPEGQARILLNDMSATKAHNLDEMTDRGIEILQVKTVKRRPSSATWCV